MSLMPCRFIMETSRTRVLAWLHLACHGLAGAACSGEEFGPGGEVDSVNVVKTELCVKTIRANRERIVGVKVRLDRNISNNGENERFVLKQALVAAREAEVPLMIHHTNSTVSLEEVLESLSPGDVYTHTLSQWAGEGRGILDSERRAVRPCVLQARARGILFDVGHGQGSFSWEIAEVCARAGFYPDTLSTDLHSGNVDGLARDLPWVMSKFLHLGTTSLIRPNYPPSLLAGMPLADLITAVSSSPAQLIGRQAELGRLEAGREADISVLSLDQLELPGQQAVDCAGQQRNLTRLLRPRYVIRRGELATIVQD